MTEPEPSDDARADGELPPGFRPRWLPVLGVIVVGALLPPLPSEVLRAAAPLLLLAASRHWVGRWTRLLMAVGSAAHTSLVVMLLFPEPLVGPVDPAEALLPAIFLARVIEIPWMIAYARSGLR
ncbi:MAG: hypothetical protein KF901_30355 [Myxococcales bacterium]|nr:hypothetical protein [Myxococcales bacterium]